METVISVLIVSLAVIAICATVLEFGLLYALREKIRLIHEIVNLVDSKTKDLNAKVDLVKSLYDSLDDGQAQLNFRVQHLEMLNSNATLTDKYDPLNPSGVMYDTQVITNKPETINFTEE